MRACFTSGTWHLLIHGAEPGRVSLTTVMLTLRGASQSCACRVTPKHKSARLHRQQGSPLVLEIDAQPAAVVHRRHQILFSYLFSPAWESKELRLARSLDLQGHLPAWNGGLSSQCLHEVGVQELANILLSLHGILFAAAVSVQPHQPSRTTDHSVFRLISSMGHRLCQLHVVLPSDCHRCRCAVLLQTHGESLRYTRRPVLAYTITASSAAQADCCTHIAQS